MIDVCSKKCIKCNVTQAGCNYAGETAQYCSKCKSEGTIDVRHPKCITCNAKRANFNYAGETAKYCSKCKSPNMIDVHHPKCASGHCPQHANPKYDKYCAFCFIHLFPEDERSINVMNKSRELNIVIHLIHRFKHQFEFIYKPFQVDFGGGCCAKRRNDLLTTVYNTTISIEIDADQYKKYVRRNENARYDDLFMDFSGKYIFIRFNPDSFIENGETQNQGLQTRLPALEDALLKQVDRVKNYENKESVEVVHLFYYQ